MELKFYDREHKKFYEQKTKDKKFDRYSKALIYLLSMIKETRQHFNDIYDIEKREIKPEVLKTSWQTSTSLVVCRLAFNLYNDFCYDIVESYYNISSKYTVSNIFCHTVFAEYFFEAICVRYGIKRGE